MNRTHSLFVIAVAAVFCLVGCSASQVRAQQPEPVWFTQAELDQMLAPVALYPDTVLSHLLIAATYPLEIVQAARWSRAHPGLRGEEAVAAVAHKDWDPSVMALVAFPELLARMDEDLEWTQRLGDAFLGQEEQVVESIQNLRQRAYAHGSLQSNEHVRVVREKEYIYVEPARTRVVYVPFYNPTVVYGPWWWATHPPVYWHRPAVVYSSFGIYWGVGYRVAPAFYFSAFHWPRRHVVVHHHFHHHYHRHPRHVHHRHVHRHVHYHEHRHFSSGREIARYDGARRWQHDPHHRRGVSYRQNVPEQRLMGRHSTQSGAQDTARRMPNSRVAQRDWAASQRVNRGLETGSAGTSQRAGTDRPLRTTHRGDQRVAGAGSSAGNLRAAVDGRQAQRVEPVGSASRGGDRGSSPATASARAGSEQVQGRLQRQPGASTTASTRPTTHSTPRAGQARQQSGASTAAVGTSRPAASSPARTVSERGTSAARGASTDSATLQRRLQSTPGRSQPTQQAGSGPRPSRATPPSTGVVQSSPRAGSGSAAPRSSSRPAVQAPQRSSAPAANRAPTRPASASAPRQVQRPTAAPRSATPPRTSSQGSASPRATQPARAAPRSASPPRAAAPQRSAPRSSAPARTTSQPRSSGSSATPARSTTAPRSASSPSSTQRAPARSAESGQRSRSQSSRVRDR